MTVQHPSDCVDAAAINSAKHLPLNDLDFLPDDHKTRPVHLALVKNTYMLFYQTLSTFPELLQLVTSSNTC